jgi:hypothetical protein
MKSIKLLFAFTTILGMFTLSACSSSRKLTKDTTTPSQEESSIESNRMNAKPNYTMANLGASTSGRSK